MLDMDFVTEDFVFTWWMLYWSLSTFWSACCCSCLLFFLTEHWKLHSLAAGQWFLNRGKCAWRRAVSSKRPHRDTQKNHGLSTSASLLWVLIRCNCNSGSCPKVRMQVSLVCTDHRGGVSRTTEDRLNRQNANSPNTGTRSKFRAVAMVARSLGQLSVQSVPSSSEQSMKTGMKYR